MRRTFITVSILFSFLLSTEAQTDIEESKTKARFSSINLAGVGSGDNGESLFIKTINGIAKGKWFGGLGVGIDYYGYRSVPIFADVRYDVLSKTNSLFIYADAGLNRPWATNNQKNNRGWPTVFKNGLIYEGGIGLKMNGKHNRAVVIICGYNYKQTKEEVTIPGWGNERGDQKEYYDSRFRRILFGFGLQL